MLISKLKMTVKGYNLIKDKNVLLMGLGTLGGGLATAKWLLKNGACLTITDLRPASKLKSSLKELSGYRGRIKFTLGCHDNKDFLASDMVVVNPGVSFRNEFVRFATHNGKNIDNELTLFYKFCKEETLAVTGTRGKTTTVNWLLHFLKTKYPGAKLAGNSGDSQLLSIIDKIKRNNPVVLELPSFLLEFFPNINTAPDVAVITNIYRDHLNRYKNIKDYALVKANIFKNQNKNQKLILNAGNKWTRFFLKQNPRAKVMFFSVKPLKGRQNGIFVGKNLSVYIKRGRKKKLFYDAQVFIERWGRLNV